MALWHYCKFSFTWRNSAIKSGWRVLEKLSMLRKSWMLTPPFRSQWSQTSLGSSSVMSNARTPFSRGDVSSFDPSAETSWELGLLRLPCRIWILVKLDELSSHDIWSLLHRFPEWAADMSRYNLTQYIGACYPAWI